MAQFRSTADLVDSVLTRCGETTNGNSTYDSAGIVLEYLNRCHFSIVAGGTIALGKDATVEIDEVWPWAKAKRPLILELEPKYTTGSIAINQGDYSGTFSSAPTYSVEGWYIRFDGVEGLYRIAQHTASSTAFALDAAYPSDDLTAGTFRVMKLDYDLTPAYLVIDSTNNKIQFQETAGTTLTGTITSGTYAPADLATAVAAAMNTVGGSVYSASYSSTTKLFTITSNRAGTGGKFILIGTGDQASLSSHGVLGFDDADLLDAASVTSTYILGGIARMIEPMKVHRGQPGEIFGIDSESFARDWPLNTIEEGTPDKFCVVREGGDGSLRVRFNKYPVYKTRVEVEHVPVPRDLKDNAASIPLLPRKHIDVLEDAASFYISFLKNDDRAGMFAQLAQGKLTQMITQNRGQLLRLGNNFGRIIPRPELAREKRRFYAGYTESGNSTTNTSTTQSMTKVTLTYTDFQTAATSKTVTVRTLPSNRTLFSVIAKDSIAFLGASISALKLDLGIVGDTTKFLSGYDLLAAVSAGNQASALTVYYPGVSTGIIATVTATGANLSALSAGSIDFYFQEAINS